jgi:hypothetical protein
MRYYWRMNRRNFFGSLAVLPFIGSLVKAADFKPKKVIMSSMYGTMGKINRWDILSPQEIADAGFVWVVHPVFTADDQSYCIKTKKLHLWLPPEGVEAFTSGRELFWGCKEEAIRQIKLIGFTHVYSVSFNPSPVYNPTTCESLGHMAFVRGANVFWYRGSVYEAAVNRV